MSDYVKKRNSTIEILRIIIMFLIVIHHCVVHSGFPTQVYNFNFNKIILGWLRLGDLSVDVFVIIMGYYTCKIGFNFKKILKLYSSVLFYSILFFIIGCIIGYNIDFIILGKSLFPFILNHYWFISVYFLIQIFSPFINIFIKSISKKGLDKCILIMLFFWSVVPTFTTKLMYGTEIAQFLMLYLIGARIRLYPLEYSKYKQYINLGIIIPIVLLYGASFVIEFLKKYISIFIGREYFLYVRNSILIISIATCLVLKFTGIKQFHNRIINKVSDCMFGVYLIHENIIMREIIWKQLFLNVNYFNNVSLGFRIIISSFVVFCACVVIEYFRKRFLEIKLVLIFEKIYKKLILYIKSYSKYKKI